MRRSIDASGVEATYHDREVGRSTKSARGGAKSLFHRAGAASGVQERRDPRHVFPRRSRSAALEGPKATRPCLDTMRTPPLALTPQALRPGGRLSACHSDRRARSHPETMRSKPAAVGRALPRRPAGAYRRTCDELAPLSTGHSIEEFEPQTRAWRTHRCSSPEHWGPLAYPRLACNPPGSRDGSRAVDP